MKSIEVKLRILTPVYTGGVDNKSEQVHATGIMGSLRWWYEAVLRGYGLRACDPILHRCSFDETEKQLCAACRTFGATGYARRFRLEVISQDVPAWSKPDALNIKPFGRTRGWYLNAGRIGSETLLLTGTDTAVNRMIALLRLLERYGSIGAKPQLGCGVFSIESVKDCEKGNAVATPSSFDLSLRDGPIGELPDLRAFTFFRFRFDPPNPHWWTQVSGIKELRARRDDWAIVERQAAQGMVPVSPALKNHIRYGWRWPGSIASWLFGTMSGKDRIRSKIIFSWAYRNDAAWEVRGWVYLPKDRTGQAFYNYPDNLKQLKDALEDRKNWLHALGLEDNYKLQAEVVIEPKSSAWMWRAPDETKRFVEGALRERKQA